MQRVLRLIEQQRRQFDAHPFFLFLRDDRVAPATRMAYAPYCCHFVLIFADINKYVLRDEQSTDRYQQIVNRHTREDDNHWLWYLHDLAKLRMHPADSFAGTVHFIWGDAGSRARELGYCVIGYALRAEPLLRLVIVEALEATGHVWLNTTVKLTQALPNGHELLFFNDHHMDCEIGHSTDADEVREIVVPPALRPLAAEAVQAIFGKMTAFCTEMLERLQPQADAMVNHANARAATAARVTTRRCMHSKGERP